MSSEIAVLEPKLKEVLYRCLEDIRATKAALYLVNGENVFQLITQYGFRNLDRRPIDPKDDLIDRILMRRTPFFVNSLTEDPRFSQTLFAAGTTRMLIAPMYGRGKLIGFVDMRDKAAKENFGLPDLEASQKITEQFMELFAHKGLFGQKPAPKFQPRAVLDIPKAGVDTSVTIEEAKRAIARGVLRNRTVQESLTENQLEAGATVLPAVLTLPGVHFAAFSSFAKFGGFQRIVARAELTSDARQKLEVKLKSWLQKRGEPEGLTTSSISYPIGKAPVPVSAARIGTIQSAPVQVGSVKGLVLTVGFETPPTTLTRGMLAGLLAQCQQIVEYAISHEALRTTQIRTAEKLLEPDMQKYPALAAHSRRVSESAERLARFVGCTAAEVHTARVAGLVHDVGMRLLDYNNLYRKPTITGEDLKVLKEHPIVGAALIADSALGPEVAHIVLCHHERLDGSGYPHGLTGDSIPLISRIIHVCECFDAMTAADSYQTPVPAPAALARIRRVGGTQLDDQLVIKFVEMLSSAQYASR